MPRKPRRLKTPMQLWVVDNRERLRLTPADLAKLTGVEEPTARGWESRGRPGEDAIRKLEEKFGVPAPDGDEVAGDQSALIAQISDLVEELRLTRQEQAEWNRGVAEALALFARRLPVQEPTDGPSPVRSEVARR